MFKFAQICYQNKIRRRSSLVLHFQTIKRYVDVAKLWNQGHGYFCYEVNWLLKVPLTFFIQLELCFDVFSGEGDAKYSCVGGRKWKCNIRIVWLESCLHFWIYQISNPPVIPPATIPFNPLFPGPAAAAAELLVIH